MLPDLNVNIDAAGLARALRRIGAIEDGAPHDVSVEDARYRARPGRTSVPGGRRGADGRARRPKMAETHT